MPVKSIDLPPDVARAFVEDMCSFFAETDVHKADEIAIRQLNVLQAYQGPRERKLRISDIKAMFRQMRNELA